MRNFYLSGKFCALTKNFSEVVLPRQIPQRITVSGKERLRNVLNTSPKRVNKNSLTWWYVLKTSWRCLEDVFQDVLKTYSQDEYIGLDQDVLKTSSEDVRLRRTYSSWSRRLEDVFWRRRRKTSSRRLQNEFIKTNACLDGTSRSQEDV